MSPTKEVKRAIDAWDQVVGNAARNGWNQVGRFPRSDFVSGEDEHVEAIVFQKGGKNEVAGVFYRDVTKGEKDLIFGPKEFLEGVEDSQE